MRAWTFSSTRRGSSLTCPPGAAAFALAKEEMAVRLGVGGRLVGVGVGVIWGWVGGRWEWVWVGVGVRGVCEAFVRAGG